MSKKLTNFLLTEQEIKIIRMLRETVDTAGRKNDIRVVSILTNGQRISATASVHKPLSGLGETSQSS